MIRCATCPALTSWEKGCITCPRVQYGKDHPRQYMECIYKDGPTNRPVVVWIHGGGWTDEYLTTTYRPERCVADLAQAGFFIACIEYRLAPARPLPRVCGRLPDGDRLPARKRGPLRH